MEANYGSTPYMKSMQPGHQLENEKHKLLHTHTNNVSSDSWFKKELLNKCVLRRDLNEMTDALCLMARGRELWVLEQNESFLGSCAAVL